MCKSPAVRQVKKKQVKQVVEIMTYSYLQHCLCEEETQKKVDSLHDAFNKVCAQNHYRT